MTKANSSKDFEKFQKRVDKELMSHRIICENAYTQWFANADLDVEEVRHFAQQFSVFSNLFIVAQLKKVINAESLEEMHTSKEILMNELGVVFHRSNEEDQVSKAKRLQNKENEGDPAFVNTEGTVESGVFKFKAAHFEWLLSFVKPLGMGFKDIGKRKHGTNTTLFFTDALERIYGSEDFSEAAGASYAIENWAAAGFWKELVAGLKKFKEQSGVNIPLSFFTWHDKVEDQHAAHTQEELKEVFFYERFNPDKFIRAGQEMLDACAVFWDGLNQDRLKKRPTVALSQTHV